MGGTENVERIAGEQVWVLTKRSGNEFAQRYLSLLGIKTSANTLAREALCAAATAQHLLNLARVNKAGEKLSLTKSREA